MPTTLRSYAKINLGLTIGPIRDDGFHELRTVYQTIALHDMVKVELGRGTGIEIRCKNPKVPADESNTCYRTADRFMKAIGQRGKVAITIEKILPLQGGLGAASSNAVATLFALERESGRALDPEDQLRICEEVGSDLPLFLVGGTVYGEGRGEQVIPLEELPPADCWLAARPFPVVEPERAAAGWPQRLAPAQSLPAADSLVQWSSAPWFAVAEAREQSSARSRSQARWMRLDR